MSTRSCYIFKDKHGSYAVYKHSDGYPTGAAETLIAAKKYAWYGERWEADEFAAAFVAAGKFDVYESRKKYAKQSKDKIIDAGGQMRLLVSAEMKDMPGDIEYLYVVRDVSNSDTPRVTVQAYSVKFPWGDDAEPHSEKHLTAIFECLLDDVKAVATDYEKKRA